MKELPKRITRRWLESLSDDDLRRVCRLLDEESANYQSYSDARTISDRWQRAHDEMLRRGLVR